MEELTEKLKNIVLNTCNAIVCKDCDLKWDDGCSATDLQDRIISLGMEEFLENQNQ